MDLQLTNYFPSETEGAKYEDRDISMDPQFSNNFPSETEGVGYEDGGIDRTIYFWGTEMPKWFNHQSVDDSIFFFVGRKFPKLAVCIVPGREVVSVSVHISINGYKKSDLYFRDLSRFRREMPDLFDEFKFLLIENNLFLFSLTQRSLQRHLNKSNPTDQNLVEVSITYSKNGYSVKRWGSTWNAPVLLKNQITMMMLITGMSCHFMDLMMLITGVSCHFVDLMVKKNISFLWSMMTHLCHA